MLPDIELPEKLTTETAGKSGKQIVKVAWGFWRIWEDVGNVLWQHVILVDEKLVHDEKFEGEGSIPLIVMRFNPDSMYAFGNGPMIQAKPMLRIVDCLLGATQDRTDIANDPPFTFPNDGVVNFEGGIQAGKGYPAAPGSGRDFVPLYFEGDVNLGFVTIGDLDRSIKRLFFNDFPEQGRQDTADRVPVF